MPTVLKLQISSTSRFTQRNFQPLTTLVMTYCKTAYPIVNMKIEMDNLINHSGFY